MKKTLIHCEKNIENSSIKSKEIDFDQIAERFKEKELFPNQIKNAKAILQLLKKKSLSLR
jgi:hypothetical protein